ncbi:hypothetical protein ACELLULO517_05765 [Acidisoma cellulosilytica]|uniref:Phospholipase D n=1 Tax=Acidisoma cellulosilyticum TaxID=2802395 RepID=A0A963Z0G3_9PROT|nr:phospholipase D-like domain-containing protein [Acidisoma cellulosilyticum]MCB8879732.1 hypothetical protein [Acidisoma cellulosilyticum]
MRQQVKAQGLVLQAVAGTHVVLLGWDITDQTVAAGLLGFAIQRVDHAKSETYWMSGMKSFPATPLPLGGTASSHEQPIQSFQWADYSAQPGCQYTYRLVAMSGQPGALTDGAEVAVDITTEAAWAGTHSIFFNRGAVASQEYAKLFQNRRPSVVGPAAYTWLSRGLLEAIIAFLAKATDASYGIRMAIYEFQWPEVLKAVSDAAQRGADVRVLYDAIDNAHEDPIHPNEAAIAAAGIDKLCTGITHGRIMHNKFIVLLKDGAPVQLLTGSTNYTENGIFGHLNCAHIVNDAATASAYLDLWTELSGDPALADLRDWNDTKTPVPPNPPIAGITEVFSPLHSTAVLARYNDIAAAAQRGLFMTFAFGMNKDFIPTYETENEVLHFALMDKAGVGKTIAAAEAEIAKIRALKNAVVAIGQNITLNEFDRWLKEASGVQAKENVRWVHTKFMLVDPLSDDPIVVTGSANFSDASVTTNHENMLVIRGDKRVADIYLGEFMRQFSSYAFRDAAYTASQQSGAAPETWKPQDLATDPSWMADYNQPGSSRALRRLYFSGQ